LVQNQEALDTYLDDLGVSEASDLQELDHDEIFKIIPFLKTVGARKFKSIISNPEL
jgi:hypothetical protein